MLLHELKWNGGNGLEDLILDGLLPSKRYVDLLEMYMEDYWDNDDDDTPRWLFLELKTSVDKSEAAASRMLNELCDQRRVKSQPRGRAPKPATHDTLPDNETLYSALARHDGASLCPDWPADRQKHLTRVLDELRQQVMKRRRETSTL